MPDTRPAPPAPARAAAAPPASPPAHGRLPRGLLVFTGMAGLSRRARQGAEALCELRKKAKRRF